LVDKNGGNTGNENTGEHRMAMTAVAIKDLTSGDQELCELDVTAAGFFPQSDSCGSLRVAPADA